MSPKCSMKRLIPKHSKEAFWGNLLNAMDVQACTGKCRNMATDLVLKSPQTYSTWQITLKRIYLCALNMI